MTQTVPDRAAVYREVASGIADGLPAPVRLHFNGNFFGLDFDSIAELRQWAERFEIEISNDAGQPYPKARLTDPAKATDWLISEFKKWNSQRVHLTALDPITDEQRQYWINSGQADQHEDVETTRQYVANAAPVSEAR